MKHLNNLQDLNSNFIQPGFNQQKNKNNDIRLCSRFGRGGLKGERSDGPFDCYWSLRFQSLEDQMQFSDCLFRATTSLSEGNFFVLFCCAKTMRNVMDPHLLDHFENRLTSWGIQIPERKRGGNGESVNVIVY